MIKYIFKTVLLFLISFIFFTSTFNLGFCEDDDYKIPHIYSDKNLEFGNNWVFSLATIKQRYRSESVV